MKALVGAFNQEKALVGAFSVIVKADCETDGALHSTVPGPWRQARRHPGQLLTLRWSHTSTNYWGYHCSVTTTSHPQSDNYDIIIHSSVMSSICSPTTTTYLESRQSMLAITISSSFHWYLQPIAYRYFVDIYHIIYVWFMDIPFSRPGRTSFLSSRIITEQFPIQVVVITSCWSMNVM